MFDHFFNTLGDTKLYYDHFLKPMLDFKDQVDYYKSSLNEALTQDFMQFFHKLTPKKKS